MLAHRLDNLVRNAKGNIGRLRQLMLQAAAANQNESEALNIAMAGSGLPPASVNEDHHPPSHHLRPLCLGIANALPCAVREDAMLIPRPKKLVEESTVTSRGRTTIPKAIREALNLGVGDRVRFALTGDNTVVLTRSDDHDDSAVSMFLAFLEADMHEKPGNVRPVPQDLLERARILVEGIAVDLETPLNPDDS